MLPIILDSDQISVLLVGAGPLVERRYQLLQAAGVADLTVFAVGPDVEIAAGIEGALSRMPTPADLEGIAVLFIAGLERERAVTLVAEARAQGVLVNTEDDRALCDFHVPASVRRGDLLFTVSTGGASPGLARRLRKHIEAQFGEEWDARVSDLSVQRTKWREEGLDLKSIAEKSDAWIDSKGWLK